MELQQIELIEVLRSTGFNVIPDRSLDDEENNFDGVIKIPYKMFERYLQWYEKRRHF